MDDRRLQSLIRMATEIEEMERAAEAALLPRVLHTKQVGEGRSRASGRRWALRIGTFAAAAACIGLAMVMSRGVSPRSNPPQPVAVKPSASDLDPIVPRPPMQLVAKPSITPEYARKLIETLEGMNDVSTGVLAIYEDSAGVVRCVRWHPYDFGGRELDELTPGEVVRVSYGRPHCAVVGPHRLIAVAVRGPIKNLPTSDERAQALAECIRGEPLTRCEAQAMVVADNSPGCLPHGLEFMVETLAMGRN